MLFFVMENMVEPHGIFDPQKADTLAARLMYGILSGDDEVVIVFSEAGETVVCFRLSFSQLYIKRNANTAEVRLKIIFFIIQ